MMTQRPSRPTLRVGRRGRAWLGVLLALGLAAGWVPGCALGHNPDLPDVVGGDGDGDIDITGGDGDYSEGAGGTDGAGGVGGGGAGGAGGLGGAEAGEAP